MFECFVFVKFYAEAAALWSTDVKKPLSMAILAWEMPPHIFEPASEKMPRDIERNAGKRRD